MSENIEQKGEKEELNTTVESHSAEAFESPEALQDKLSNSVDFVKDNKNTFIYVVGTIAILVSGFFFYKYYQSSQNKDANAEMFTAVGYWEKDSLNKALNGDGKNPGLKTIAEDYSGSKAGNLANFYLGDIYLKKGEFDKAIEALNQFSSNDLVLQGRAYCLLGDAHMEKNKFDEAVDFYQKAADYKPNEQFTPRYLMKLALAAEKKKDNAKAIEAYDNIITNYPTSQEYNEAKKYKALLEGVK